MIRLIVFILLLVIGFTVLVMNTEPTVVLHYFMGYATGPIPIYQLVAGAFITGMVVAGIFLVPEWIRLRLELRRQRKALRRIEEEMERIRPASPADRIHARATERAAE